MLIDDRWKFCCRQQQQPVVEAYTDSRADLESATDVEQFNRIHVSKTVRFSYLLILFTHRAVKTSRVYSSAIALLIILLTVEKNVACRLHATSSVNSEIWP